MVGGAGDGHLHDVASFVDDELSGNAALQALAAGGGRVAWGALAARHRFVLEVIDVKDIESAEVLGIYVKGGEGKVSGEGTTGAGFKRHVELLKGNGWGWGVELRGRLFLFRFRRRGWFLGRWRWRWRRDLESFDGFRRLFVLHEELRQGNRQKEENADGNAKLSTLSECVFTFGRVVNFGHEKRSSAGI